MDREERLRREQYHARRNRETAEESRGWKQGEYVKDVP